MSDFIEYLLTGPPFAMAFGLCVTLAALAWLLSGRHPRVFLGGSPVAALSAGVLPAGGS